MRLALVIGANPRTYRPGHISIVKPGKWKIVADGLHDSTFIVKNHTQQLSLHDEFELESHTGFSVEFTKAGTEQLISIFAERS